MRLVPSQNYSKKNIMIGSKMDAKEIDQEIVQADLEKFVLTQDDFGLELFVYGTARNNGFQATHGGSYSDRVTGKSRQYDIRASIAVSSKVRVDLAIECKCTKSSYPVLISRIPRLPEESFHQRIIAPGTDVFRMGQGRLAYGIALVENFGGVNSLYVPNEYVGKSITQVGKRLVKNGKDYVEKFSSGDSEIFDKWGQALASANDLIGRAALHSNVTAKAENRTLVIPVIVVSDKTLWVVDYSENGVLQGPPVLTEEAIFFVGERYELAHKEYAISHIHIYTKTGIIKFFESLRDDSDYRERISFCDDFDPNWKAI